jgi:hypothetical protein
MPTPTTLVQFWQQERDVYANLVTKAQAKLTNAQAAVTQANKDLADEQKNFGTLSDDIAAKRKKLAETTIPADAAALVVVIRDLMISQRISQGKLLDLAEGVDAAKADVDAATAVTTRVSAKRAEAEAKLEAAQDEDRIRQAGKAAVGNPPLSTIKADATAAQTGPDQTAAAAKIGDIPADLRTIATSRAALRTKRLADAQTAVAAAEDALADERNTKGGLAGAAAKKGVAFRRAERKLLDHVAGAKLSYDRAIGLFKRVGGDPVLSAAEKAEATSFNSGGDGSTAEANAATVVGDQVLVDTDRNGLETTTFTKQLADIDGDVSANGDVVTARNKLQTDLDTLRDDSNATNYPDKTTLDQWQAIVPDGAWQKLLDFQEGTAILARIAATSATLVTDVVAAETAYAGALYEAAQSQRRLDYAQDAIARRAKRVTDVATALPGRLLSAVRGDTF